MRVRLKGIYRVTSRLADGSPRTYYYAWRNGPRLEGEPGTPAFLKSYELALSRRSDKTAGTLASVFAAFQNSEAFRSLAERTRKDYQKILAHLHAEFGELEILALEEDEARDLFMEWRDERALKSKRQADYAWVVLGRTLSWAKNRGKVKVNPCEKGGRLYNGGRADLIWTEDHERIFIEKAPERMHLPFYLGLCTGQRQGDILRLKWSNYTGTHLLTIQRKSIRRGNIRDAVRVKIPVIEQLKTALDRAPRDGEHILLNSDGTPWTEHSFRVAWRRARQEAGITGVTYHDLRGTAVTRLAIAGCTELEIAAITGHSAGDVRSILQAHYLFFDQAIAERAMQKMQAHNLQNKVQNDKPRDEGEGAIS